IDAGIGAVERARKRQATIWSSVRETWLSGHCSEVTTLGAVLADDLSNGRSVRDGDGYHVLRLDAVVGGRIDPRRAKQGLWTRAEGSAFRVRRGDFLIVRGNGSRSLVGRGGLVEDDADVAF